MADETPNPIDELMKEMADFTLDRVVNSHGGMSTEERMLRVKALRAKRALWVPGRKK